MLIGVSMSVNLNRVKQIIEHLSSISSVSNELTRLAFSCEDKIAKDYLLSFVQDHNLSIKKDEIGNIMIRRSGVEDRLPSVAFGSHIDTVINAGKFDGPLGTVAGLEILLQLCENNIKTKYPLELIIFNCEESSRFNYATLGSKVMCGVADPETLLKLKDKQGISLEEILIKHNSSIDVLYKAKRKPDSFKCFFELHIEQGPCLENENKTIGIVTGIAAPIRCIVRIKGQADHSGATAMHYRHDALLAGAELAIKLEQLAIEAGSSTVATVGNLQVKPGVMNVVPGDAELLIDIRGVDLIARDFVYSSLQKYISKVAEKRGVDIELQPISSDKPVLLSQKGIEQLKNICEGLDYSYEIMPSGAGHDAMHMANLCPTNMIFVPSKLGISHNPLEFTEWKDIEAGIKVLQQAVLQQAEVLI